MPLGCLYLTRSLEDAGFSVDFRDYQLCGAEDPFDKAEFLNFLEDPAPLVGLSCMANLLPFTILAARELKARYPDRVIILGGVGPKAVEDKILSRFPWIDIVSRGEGELTGPELMGALRRGGDLSAIKGISYRRNEEVIHTPDRERIRDIDSIPYPAYEPNRPRLLPGLRNDDQPRLSLPMHILLGGSGMEHQELLAAARGASSRR